MRTDPAALLTREHVRAWIQRHGGNVSACARRLDVPRRSLVGWMADPEQSSSARVVQRDVWAHMQTLDALQSWLARWGAQIPATAREEAEAVLRGESPAPPDTELTRRMDDAG